METLLWIGGGILLFDLFILLILLLRYSFIGRHREGAANLETFCSTLPAGTRLPDPYTLVNGKWVHKVKPRH